MINYLKGKLISKHTNSPQGSYITIEINNIGYIVNVNSRILKTLSDINTEIQVFTSLIHKEDSMSLCGFLKQEDRDLFNILQSVSGVGTKVALLLLENMNAKELTQAVLEEDTKALCSTKGVGPKLAKRLILELKDKMHSWAKETEINYEKANSTLPEEKTEAYIEAHSVLVSLGYTSVEINQGLSAAIEKTGNGSSSEELLKIALQAISF